MDTGGRDRVQCQWDNNKHKRFRVILNYSGTITAVILTYIVLVSIYTVIGIEYLYKVSIDGMYETALSKGYSGDRSAIIYDYVIGLYAFQHQPITHAGIMVIILSFVLVEFIYLRKLMLKGVNRSIESDNIRDIKER